VMVSVHCAVAGDEGAVQVMPKYAEPPATTERGKPESEIHELGSREPALTVRGPVPVLVTATEPEPVLPLAE